MSDNNSGGKFFRYIDDIPPVWKGITVVGILAVTVGVGFMVYKGIDRRAKNKEAERKAKETVASTDATLLALSSNNIKPNFSITQYKSWADELEACFQGWGTCSGWFNVFNSLKNQADMIMLIQQYGVRKISSGKFNPEPDFVGGLSATLTNELSTSDIVWLKQRMRDLGVNFDI